MANLKNTVINDTGYLKLPVGPTGARPGSSTDVFTTVGTTTWTAPTGVTSVEVLVVGGGGGGVSGGGGAGSVVYHSGLAVTPGSSYTVTVGAGGIGGVASGGANGLAGMASIFASITAPGGGRGGSNDSNPGPTTGGSGGGGGATSTVTTTGASATAGTGGTASYQNAGGTATASASPYAAAGGGGAGQVGQNIQSASVSGAGGNGITDASINNILAAAGAGVVVSGTRYIGGGGGGCTWVGGLNGGRGGYGGGGNGSFFEAVASQAGNVNGDNGQDGTGGGGGGGSGNSGGRGGNGGSGIVILRYTTAQTSTTPVNGMTRYNSTLGGPELYMGGAWRPVPLPFFARSIITTAYTMGGYKNSTAWNNVNRTVAATDTTTNLGDGSMERTFNYQSAGVGPNNAFIFGAANVSGTASNYIIGYNMRAETQLTSGFTRTMNNNNYNTGTIFKETDLCWNSGGGSNVIEEFNFTTQTMYVVNGTLGWTGETWGMSHEKFGVFYTNESANNFEFSTRTIMTRSGTAVGAHHQQKSVQSKLNYCYAGNEGTYNGGYYLRRTNMYTNTTAGGVFKPYQNCGEENFTMGQEHQYMIGNYDGAQNNGSWRFNYVPETGYCGSSSMQPKGKAGASSASNAWRS